MITGETKRENGHKIVTKFQYLHHLEVHEAVNINTNFFHSLPLEILQTALKTAGNTHRLSNAISFIARVHTWILMTHSLPNTTVGLTE